MIYGSSPARRIIHSGHSCEGVASSLAPVCSGLESPGRRRTSETSSTASEEGGESPPRSARSRLVAHGATDDPGPASDNSAESSVEKRVSRPFRLVEPETNGTGGRVESALVL